MFLALTAGFLFVLVALGVAAEVLGVLERRAARARTRPVRTWQVRPPMSSRRPREGRR